MRRYLALVLNGDSFFEVNIEQFYNLHTEQKADMSVALRRVDDASRYGTVELGEANSVISFKEKSPASNAGLINGGVYILDKKKYVEHTAGLMNFSIEKDFFEKQLNDAFADQKAEEVQKIKQQITSERVRLEEEREEEKERVRKSS